MTSASEDSSFLVLPSAISSKAWHLTFCPQFKELFIWRNGMRLKGKSGSSIGPVKTVSVLDEVDRTVTVSIVHLHIVECACDPSLHKQPHSIHKQTTL